MANETAPCTRCNGTGEEYRPDLTYSDGPWIDCPKCLGYGFEQDPHSLRHCTAILTAYQRDGWPLHYRADVEVHDMCELAERDPALPFVWTVREMGSHIMLPERDRSLRPHNAPPSFGGWWDRMHENLPDYEREGHRIYWWDGHQLVQVPAARAVERWFSTVDRIRRARERERRAA